MDNPNPTNGEETPPPRSGRKEGEKLWPWVGREASITDWVIAVFTVVIGIVAILQYCEQVNAGKQADKQIGHLIDAANTQGLAAVQNFQAARQFAAAMKDQAGATQTIANNAGK